MLECYFQTKRRRPDESASVFFYPARVRYRALWGANERGPLVGMQQFDFIYDSKRLHLGIVVYSIRRLVAASKRMRLRGAEVPFRSVPV